MVGAYADRLRVLCREVAPLLLRRLGPGRYRVEWIGPGGVVLYVEEIEIPNLEREAVRLKLEEERARDLQAQARREARDRKKLEADSRRRARAEHRLTQDHAAWAHDVAGVVIREGARRVRWSEAQILAILQGAAKAGAEHAASYGRQAESLRRQADSLRRQAELLLRVRLGEDGGSLRRPVDLPELVGEELDPPLAPAGPPPPWHQTLVAELQRVRSTDLAATHALVVEQLLERAEDLFPLPPLHPA